MENYFGKESKQKEQPQQMTVPNEANVIYNQNSNCTIDNVKMIADYEGNEPKSFNIIKSDGGNVKIASVYMESNTK